MRASSPIPRTHNSLVWDSVRRRMHKMGYGFPCDRSSFRAVNEGIGRRLVSAVWIATLFLLAPGRMPAQVLYGSLVGNVKDSSGAAVAKATVTATNNGTNQSRAAVTDDGGGYSFND